MNLKQYLIDVKARQNATSWRHVSRMINIQHSSVRGYLEGWSLPSDENMIKIAELGGNDPVEALLWLNAERAKGRAKPMYQDMLEKRQAAA